MKLDENEVNLAGKKVKLINFRVTEREYQMFQDMGNDPDVNVSESIRDCIKLLWYKWSNKDVKTNDVTLDNINNKYQPEDVKTNDVTEPEATKVITWKDYKDFFNSYIDDTSYLSNVKIISNGNNICNMTRKRDNSFIRWIIYPTEASYKGINFNDDEAPIGLDEDFETYKKAIINWIEG